ncbi:MAG TPA: HEAT repeat domain-containing protein, partial [Flavisolibacter sp.]|nr:HEAT repeat domain-containing protein [Flavisolibacter sp.]
MNEYESTLKSLPIKTNDLDFYRIDFEEEIYVQLLCIASLNSNGYVREKAVRELGRMKNVVGLKFILFRLGDWVTQVRKAATEAIDLYLDRTYTDELLKQLPTINWLLVVERVDLREVYNRITDFILSQDLSEEFYLKIKQLDDKARFYFFKTFLSNFPSSEHLSWLMGDKNFLVRLELVKHLSNLNEVTQKELIARLLSDQSARVRLEALYASKRFSPDFEEQIILLLSDESASVRELSRHLLKGKGLDFAALYRQRIEGKQFLPGSLLGLSETGNSEDVPIFEQY